MDEDDIYELSAREEQALQFIKTFITDNNYSASLEEIAAGIGTSKPYARNLTIALRFKRRIRWRSKTQRTIQVIEQVAQ